MVKKVNLSSVKEFMFNHGEKVALGTCALLALVFGTLGLVRAFSAGRADSGKPWANAFDEKRIAIATGMANAQLPVLSDDEERQLKPGNYVWDPIQSKYVQSPYVYFSGAEGHKRGNPQTLPINTVQLDYVRGLAWVYDVQGNNLRCFAAAGLSEGPAQPASGQPQERAVLPPVVKEGRPIRMVVVTARFPMIQQVEEFRRAFKMTSQKEMFDFPRADLPRPLGINVLKFEVVNGQPVNKDGEVLMRWDGKKVIKGPALDKLLQIAVYDEDTPVVLERHIHAGLITPMPKLANAHYPKFGFKGFDIAWDTLNDARPDMAGGPSGKVPGGDIVLPGGDKNPRKKGPLMPESNPGMQAGGEKKPINIKSQVVKDADLALYNRLFDKEHDYNIYHVLGQFPPPKAAEEEKPFPARENAGGNNPGRYFAPWDINPAGGAAVPGNGPRLETPMGPKLKKNPMAKPGDDPGAVFPNWDRDALVRFIDPDVVPGKSYQYVIQVRMANPNFGKKDLVAFNDLALAQELVPSPWVPTPIIHIPHEYFVYGVDQHLLDAWAAGFQANNALAKTHPFYVAKDQTTFQIHQWTEKARDTKNNGDPYVIGDWVIAERVKVRRGEQIGFQAFVQVPFWQKDKDVFELPMMQDKKKQSKPGFMPGFMMDFKADSDRPVLVDFVGGKRYKGTTTALEEETAVEALILSPDGKLTVLNSRAGTDAVQEEDPNDPTIQTSRQDRVISAQRRVREVFHGGSGDPVNPKIPGPKVPGGQKERGGG
jgi:hypothetical protein